MMEKDTHSSSPLINVMPTVQLYSRRWLMLLLFLAMYAINNILQASFVVIPSLIAKHYVPHPTDSTMQSVNLIFPMVEIPGLVLAIFLLQKFSVKVSLSICAIAQIIGGWLRFGGYPSSNFLVLVIGTVIASAAQPFLDASPTVVAGVWFGVDERTTAVSVFVAGWSLSLAFAVSVVPLLVYDDYSLKMFLLVSAGACSIIGVLNLFIQQKRPPNPPSPAALADRVSVVKSFKMLVRSPSFLILLISWGAILGTIQSAYFAAAAIYQPMYTKQETGYITATFPIAGLIASLLVGPLVDRTKQYKLTLIICYVGTATSLGILGFFFRWGSLLGMPSPFWDFWVLRNGFLLSSIRSRC
eukprot:TRINITY_DN8727_c0_g1_i2.p1 TRINITY_DN8727_c0_g1~~TRINITY_DN8727_c0_g1_i2.p1  ORF type:complete len:356 (-),score=39.15 TRINITY_DN8727_c0_g1_i2:262-1329(-)